MKPTQEPKYDVNIAGQICNRATGEPIPDDEPVFIFRARDRKARKALVDYLHACDDDGHRDAIEKRVIDFTRFAERHPDRMKEPDTVSANAQVHRKNGHE